MSERDEELGRALSRLPIPEPSEEFWEALRSRCADAFDAEAPPGDDLPFPAMDGERTPAPVTDQLNGAKASTRPASRGRVPRRGRRRAATRPPDELVPRARRRAATRPPDGPAPRARRRTSRRLRAPRVLTVALAALLVTLVGSFSTGLVRRAEAIPMIPLSEQCGRDGNAPSSENGQRLVVAGVWQKGTREADNFVKVLEAFKKDTGVGVIYAYRHDDAVRYDPTPRDPARELSKRIENGCPPDVAFLPQLGLLRDLAREQKLRPLDRQTVEEVGRNYPQAWRQLGEVNGTLYGVWFKATNKSMIWHRPNGLPGPEPPATWDELKKVAAEIHGQGVVAPFAVAGADGWTLTDWFENVYLATAGPDLYDRLADQSAAGAIPWTDPSVKQALTTLAEVLGRPEWLAGGTEGALRSSYETSVEEVLGPSPRAAMVYEGDFVAGSAHQAARGSEDPVTPRSFPFPAIGGDKPQVVGGDVAVSLTNNEAGRELVRYLATPKAAEVWAREGGFLSPNTGLDPAAYPDEATRSRARAVTENQTLRFDLSDVQPSGFGGSHGLWELFQDFLRNPGDVDSITQRLQQQAQAAWAPLLPQAAPANQRRP